MKEHLHSKQFGMLVMYSFCHQEIIVEEIKHKSYTDYPTFCLLKIE